MEVETNSDLIRSTFGSPFYTPIHYMCDVEVALKGKTELSMRKMRNNL